MITNINLENFKCFRQLEINPKQLTVLIGPNGTGKSSVLQALLLFKQWWADGRLRIKYQGELINLNGRSDIVPNFLDAHSPIGIVFSGNQYGKDFGCYYSESVSEGATTSLRLTHDYPLKQLRVVPAVRGLVRPQYQLGDIYTEQVSQGDGLGAQETQLASNLAYSSQSEERLSNLLKKVTGTGLRAEPTPPKLVAVKSTTPSGAVNIVTEGFGANALILLLHQLLTADKGATILIEEPEIHLHPKAQAELAEVLADVAKSHDKQLIITTHSEHFAGRLLTMVAEKQLTPDELAIFSFEKDEKGECSSSEIEVLPDGRVKGGLKDFFQNELDEVNRYMNALTGKQ